MELILSNLIHNAIKYSPENSVIDISINQNSKNTICTIEDYGLGIPSKDQNRMFERYFRADNVLHTEGTGIGLNIVKSHLDNLKGTIKFKSEVNKGTIFTITIPNKAE
jgi:signal transduction histidine kinase